MLNKYVEIKGFSDITGVKYRLEVLKENYSGSVINAETTSRIFRLSYKPEEDNIGANLCPSEIEFDIYSAGQKTAIDDFISDLVEYQQDSYYVKVYRQIAGQSEQRYWVGIVLQDEIREQDLSAEAGKVYSITAIDGLSLLKDKDFDYPNQNTAGNISTTSIREIIRESLLKGLPSGLWATDDEYLIMSFNWVPQPLAYSVNQNRLDDIFLDVTSLTEVEEKFDFSFFIRKTCFEVLQVLAKVFLSRVYMADGAFYFEQIPDRTDNTPKRFSVDFNGNQIQTGLLSINEAIDQRRGFARLEGGVFVNLPALKKVRVEQASYNSDLKQELLYPEANLVFYLNSPTSFTQDVGLYSQTVQNTPIPGVIPQSIEVELSFLISQTAELDTGDRVNIGYGTKPFYYGARQVVDLQIKLTDSVTAGVYYYNGSSWQTSVQSMQIEGRRNVTNVGQGVTVNLPLNVGTKRTINTAPLPATGRIEIILQNANVQKLVGLGPEQWSGINVVKIDNPQGQGIEAKFKTKYPQSDTVAFYELENSSPKIGDNEVLNMGEIELGDGALQTGHLVVLDGASPNYQAAPFWNYKDETEDLNLASLLVRERLQLQKTVLEIYDGEINHALSYSKNLVFDNAKWMPQEVEINAGKEEASGTFFYMDRIPEDGGDFNGGLRPSDSGLALDTGDSFGKWSMGGLAVGGNRVGDTVYSDDVSLSLNKKRSVKSEFVKVREIAMQDGGTYSADADDRVLLLSFEDASGSADLNLLDYDPDLDGMQLQIILDETFVGGVEVVLVTTDTTKIRGNAEFTLTGNNQYQVLLTLTSAGWY